MISRVGECSGSFPRVPLELRHLFEQLLNKLFARDLMMCCYSGQDGGERADSEWVVIRDGDVMFPSHRAGQTDMTTSLSRG